MNHTMKAADEKMSTAIEHFRHEIKGLRTGRANPAMVEGLKVSVYGAQMRLIDIASISAPEPRQLLITPYDPQNSAAIGKAIIEANLGVQPLVEAHCVRINVPPMDESLRKDMIKVCHQKLEECKVSIRNIRRECNEVIRQRKADKEISEDEARGLEKKIQEKTDEFCKKADSVAKQKEMEIFTI